MTREPEYSIAQVARATGLEPRQVRWLVESGRLVTRQLWGRNTRHRVPASELRRLEARDAITVDWHLLHERKERKERNTRNLRKTV